MNAYEKSEKPQESPRPCAPSDRVPPSGGAHEKRVCDPARRAILLLYGLMALFIAVPVVIFLTRR